VHEVKSTICTKEAAQAMTRAKVSDAQYSEMVFYRNRYRFYQVYEAGQPTANIAYSRDPAGLIEEGGLLVKGLGL